MRWRRTISAVVVFGTLLEVGALGILYWNDRAFFYLRDTKPTLDSRTNFTRTIAVLHPYLGYTVRPGITPLDWLGSRHETLFGAKGEPAWERIKHLRASALGTWLEYPFPYKAARGDFIIGLFGGSAANWFVLQAGPLLKVLLERHAPGRNVVILNFGIPGGKQPQQLLLMSYLASRGQRLDLVVNIDGFNELALGGGNIQQATDFTMPSVHMLHPLWRSADNEALTAGNTGAHFLHVLAIRSRDSIQALRADNKSAFAELVLRLAMLASDATAQSTLQRLLETPADAKKDIYVLPSATPGRRDVHDLADYWRDCSVLMEKFSRAINAHYLHVLQPHPHFGSKQMTKEENDRIQRSHPYSRAVAEGYPLLLDRIDDLRRAGVHVVSAHAIFDDVSETVYADLAHPNVRGAELLARFLAKTIINAGALR